MLWFVLGIALIFVATASVGPAGGAAAREADGTEAEAQCVVAVR
jgi:hypothetical protein